jgi:hypothetical protein
VAATTTTTIRGVSLLTPQRRRGGDAFDLALSLDGIEIRRPGQAVQRMSWSRVSQWEIEERRDYCLLTLRGDGATTPLVVPGWTLDDLEVIMREVTADSGGAPDAAPAGGDATVAAVAPVAVPETPAPVTDATPSTAPQEPRVDRRRRQRLNRRLPWKAVTTVVLLGLLAAAVALVLLQSAGVIDWGFLGPTA